MLQFNAGLMNKDCLFDSKNGFKDLRSALKWSAGRGHKYNVEIEIEADGEVIATQVYWWDNERLLTRNADEIVEVDYKRVWNN
jgi:hypothetical protein